ncbi:MAG: BCCT family transporter [Bacteroidetes bacterium]|nr:BCCT family transporter [Bacteroidota bacterium]
MKRSDKGSFMGLPLNKKVTLPSLIIIALILAFTVLVGAKNNQVFEDIQRIVSTHTGWIFILIINFILAFCIYIIFSRYGKIRLGGKDCEPEFSKKAWIAMLFSAGMGIGLLFFGVAEPMIHFTANPRTIGATEAHAAQTAMSFTFLHWGLHGWALYALVGGALAYFSFNKKQPLALRSAFFPIFGNRIYGNLGNVIDTTALIATLFGIATSLGYGVLQFTSGLEYLYGVENTMLVQVISIVVIMSIATLSVYSGINKGVKILSSWNMRIALILLLLVVVFGSTTYIFKSYIQNIGHYFSNFLELSLWSESYLGLHEDSLWQNSWTIYYWSWWCSWSPFVGLFIARISKGRTLREFFSYVVFAPSFLTFFWMTAFGGTAINLDIMGDHSISEAIVDNIGTAIYVFLENYPLPIIISSVALVLIVSFFVTSADSGALVVDLLASGGRQKTSKIQKVFWSSLIGVLTIVLTVYGGIKSLQTMVLLSGLPFAILLFLMAISLYKDLKRTLDKQQKKHKRITNEKNRVETINDVLEAIKNDEED